MDIIPVFIIVILFILAAISYEYAINKNINPSTFNFDQTRKTPSTCLCALDIDGTITLDEDNASRVIDVCKKNDCIIAINTARPYPIYQDLLLDDLHLKHEDFENDFFYGSYTDLISEENIADTKVMHMNIMAHKYNLDKSRMILFDDNHLNIEKTKISLKSEIEKTISRPQSPESARRCVSQGRCVIASASQKIGIPRHFFSKEFFS